MNVAVVLFTRDLRVHDNPALSASVRAAEHVVPLFVHDPALPAGGDRRRFLDGCLAHLSSALRSRGGDVVVLHGDPVREAVRVAKAVGASGIAVAADVSAYARSREARLAAACSTERLAFRTFPGATVVPPGAVRPAGGSHYKVFTPFYRAWQATPFRSVSPHQCASRCLEICRNSGLNRAIWVGAGESAARKRLSSWLAHLEVRRPLLRPPARRRCGQQLRQLAVGGRHGQRHEAVPPLQPAAPGRALRPFGLLRAPLRARTSDIPGKAVHTPWSLSTPPPTRRYPAPLALDAR
jgi:deoxyribodipyrimidine photolyase